MEAVKRALSIVRLRQAESRLGLSKSAIYDRMDPKSPRYDPTFPVPFRIGTGRAVGWLESSLDSWILKQAEKSIGRCSQS